MNTFVIVEVNACTDEYIGVRGVYSTEEIANEHLAEFEEQDRKFVEEHFCDVSRFYVECKKMDE